MSAFSFSFRNPASMNHKASLETGSLASVKLSQCILAFAVQAFNRYPELLVLESAEEKKHLKIVRLC